MKRGREKNFNHRGEAAILPNGQAFNAGMSCIHVNIEKALVSELSQRFYAAQWLPLP